MMVLDDAWNLTTQERGHLGVRPQHVIAFATGIVNFGLNGLIWYAFAISSKLMQKSHLHLFYAFAVTNALTGLFTLPTYMNLFLHNNLNCPRWTIMIGSAFEMGLDRMRAVLSLAIALERLHAISQPRLFFFLNHAQRAKRICAFGIAWSVADAIFMIAEDNIFTVRMHCVSTSSSGELFHAYFLASAVLFGFLLLVVYTLFLLKFLLIQRSIGDSMAKRRSRRSGVSKELVSQANSLTLAVILSVLIFSVLPSCLYGYDLIIHQVYFMDYGPVITIGYHLHGISSSFCYNYRHREIRKALDLVYPIRQKFCTHSSTHSSSGEKAAVNPTARNSNNASKAAVEMTSSAPLKPKTSISISHLPGDVFL